MRSRKNITGKVVYKNIGTGFWGIIDVNGKEWLPINFPKSLEKEGEIVNVKIQEVEGESMFMWGTLVKIVG